MKTMKTRNITHAALSLTLIFIFFLLFRGVSNILNSILIPVVLYFNISRFTWKEFLAVVLTMLIISFLFFIQQIFFFLLYVLLAIILFQLMNKRSRFLTKISLLTAGAGIGFLLSINLTDILLGTNIKKALLAITQGSQIMFLSLIVMEAIIVSLGLLLITNQMEKRIENYN